MGGKIALDTNIVINFLKGDTNIEQVLLKWEYFFLPVPVVGELIFGALNSKHSDANLRIYRKFIGKTNIIEIKKNTAEIYAKIKFTLKKNGTPIPENDVWIAALCVERDIPLISNDLHFQYVDVLKLEKAQ